MKSKIISVKFLRSVPGKWGSFNVWNIGLENGVIAEYLYKGSDCNFSIGQTIEYTLKEKKGYVDEIKIIKECDIIIWDPMPTNINSTLNKDCNINSKWAYEQAIKIYTNSRDYSYEDEDIAEIDNISDQILKWLNNA